MTSIKFFRSPDQKFQLRKKIFAANDRILQLLSFAGMAILIHEIGFLEVVKAARFSRTYSIFLLIFALGYTVRIFSKSEKYNFLKLAIEIIIILFLAFAASINLQWINFGYAFSIANLPVNPFLVHLLILIIFLIELSKLSLAVNSIQIHPALVFILSFLFLILIGTGLLSMPNATTHGISWVDAIFTSTSAVCVTGLIVLDTSSDFTFLGQFIILMLIQVGGLGIMTFTSFFGFFFKGRSSLKDQLFLKDYINEDNISAINSTLFKIILFTLMAEGIAAFFIFSSLDKELFDSLGDKLAFSIFHSISAFCNAGFSTLSSGLYETGFRYQYDFQLVIAISIIFGGIGFPVVMGYYNYLKHVMVGTKKMVIGKEDYKHTPRMVNINIRLIVYTTFGLLIVGFCTFYIFEAEHTLKGLNGYGKFVTSIFGAVTPRTAGFNTVDMNALAMPTLLIYLILMWIGASPGSTGGGIKTSTFAVALLNATSIAKGKDRIEVFNRQIDNETIKKAFAVILLSFLIIGMGTFLVLLFNPEMKLIEVAFEIFSAFSTVGLSLGITADLSTGSKLVISFIMFLGRVGTLTFLIAFFRKAGVLRYKYPEESVFIT